jgi:allophanate hydrolase
VLARLDLLCVPTIPTFYSCADLAADGIGPNARLGTYTNFVNLLEMCGLAVPMPARRDGRPGSVTLLAADGRDGLLASVGLALERTGERRMGATGLPVPPAPPLAPAARPDEIELAVCGAHMSGLPLSGELTSRGGHFLRTAETTPEYRLYRLPGRPPARPGLVRAERGASIAVEVWAMPQAELGAFLAGIPAPLSIGTVALSDGTAPKGFLCEEAAVVDAVDITALGGWRAALEAAS